MMPRRASVSREAAAKVAAGRRSVTTMKIHVHENTRTFHLQNDKISYIMTVLEGGYPGQLYFGKRIHDREEYPWLVEGALRSHAALIAPNTPDTTPWMVSHPLCTAGARISVTNEQIASHAGFSTFSAQSSISSSEYTVRSGQISPGSCP